MTAGRPAQGHRRRQDSTFQSCPLFIWFFVCFLKKDELIHDANFNIYQTSGGNKFLMQNNYFGLKKKIELGFQHYIKLYESQPTVQRIMDS